MKKLLVFLSLLVFGVGAANALPAKVANWGLAWSDEFNGTALDTTAWSYDTGAHQPNAEKEFYTHSCVAVQDGHLIIWSKYNPSGARDGGATAASSMYNSGRINTGDKKIFKYGYFEAAIQGPIGTGGKNGPLSGRWATASITALAGPRAARWNSTSKEPALVS
jgi:beta-glucanase (GH16 family)